MSETGHCRRVVMLGSEEFEARPGGLNRYFADLRAAMTAHGHDTPSVTFSARPRLASSSVRRALRTMGRTASYARRALGAMKSADVVDAHFALYALIPFMFDRGTTPRVVHFHGPWADESRASGNAGAVTYRVKRAIEAVVYRRADRVITLSRSFADRVQEYGVAPSRVAVIPPGVDLNRFREGDRPVARRKLSLAEDEFVLVCARRLENRMGIDVLLHAFSELHMTHPRSKLLIAGTGSQEQRLRQQARTMPGGESVIFTGRLPDADLASLYSAADCSVIPTLSLEGFGLVALESLASGTPVVASDIGGLPEALYALDRTLLVTPGSASALAERLRRAVTGSLPSRAACRAHAEEFSWARAAEQHTALYDSLVHRGGHG